MEDIEFQKLLCDKIYTTIQPQKTFASEEDKYKKLYAYTMLFFEENGIEISLESVDAYRIAIENYINSMSDEEVYSETFTTSQNEDSSVGKKINETVKKTKFYQNFSSIQKFILVIIIVVFIHHFFKKEYGTN